jgi:hypothetical protein
MPRATRVAVTEPEASVPNTATCSPTATEAMVGEVTPGSKYVVDLSTCTVTVVPSCAVMVNEPWPIVRTVPTAIGLASPNGC